MTCSTATRPIRASSCSTPSAPRCRRCKSGDVDTVLMDQTSADGYIGANPGAFKVVGEPLGTEDFGFILTPGSDLRDRSTPRSPP